MVLCRRVSRGLSTLDMWPLRPQQDYWIFLPQRNSKIYQRWRLPRRKLKWRLTWGREHLGCSLRLARLQVLSQSSVRKGWCLFLGYPYRSNRTCISTRRPPWASAPMNRHYFNKYHSLGTQRPECSKCTNREEFPIVPLLGLSLRHFHGSRSWV